MIVYGEKDQCFPSNWFLNWFHSGLFELWCRLHMITIVVMDVSSREDTMEVNSNSEMAGLFNLQSALFGSHNFFYTKQCFWMMKNNVEWQRKMVNSSENKSYWLIGSSLMWIRLSVKTACQASAPHCFKVTQWRLSHNRCCCKHVYTETPFWLVFFCCSSHPVGLATTIKQLYVYQIWWQDSLTPQKLEITLTFGSQPQHWGGGPLPSIYL